MLHSKSREADFEYGRVTSVGVPMLAAGKAGGLTCHYKVLYEDGNECDHTLGEEKVEMVPEEWLQDEEARRKRRIEGKRKMPPAAPVRITRITPR